jgi:3-oxo-5-alpha-steroid 4-dehydrogenase 1
MFDLSYEEEWLLHSQIANGIVYISLPIFITLYWIIPSPWGKTLAASDQKPAWWLGPLLPARISWFVFESPNLVWSYICWQQRRADLSVANVLLLVLFVLHYLRRAILYPATMSPETKPMPLAVVVSAFCFCACNG